MFLSGGATPRRSDTINTLLVRIAASSWASSVTGGGGTAAGFGSPEGVVTAVPGTIYTDQNPPYDIYAKVSGSGNTGWIMKVE